MWVEHWPSTGYLCLPAQPWKSGEPILYWGHLIFLSGTHVKSEMAPGWLWSAEPTPNPWETLTIFVPAFSVNSVSTQCRLGSAFLYIFTCTLDQYLQPLVLHIQVYLFKLYHRQRPFLVPSKRLLQDYEHDFLLLPSKKRSNFIHFVDCKITRKIIYIHIHI